METKTKAVIIALTIMIAMIPFASSAEGDHKSIATEPVTLKQYDDSLSVLSITSGASTKVESIDEIANSSDEDAILIGNTWAKTQDSGYIGDIVCQKIISGTPVITINNNLQTFEKVKGILPTCFDKDSSVHALYYDNSTGVTYCYNGNLEGENRSIQSVSKWIKEAKSTTRNSTIVVETGAWSSSLVSITEKDCGEWGQINIYNEYKYIIENNYKYNYYAGIHSVEIIPAKDHRTVSVESNISPFNYGDYTYRTLYDYTPDGTVGSGTYGASVGISVGSGGGNVDASISWTYNVNDITVHNYSNRADNLFHLVHEFNTDRDSSKETRIIKPGHTTAVNCDDGYFKDGTYIGSDDFTITFEKTVKKLFNEKKEKASFTIELSPLIYANPCTITYHSNGATAHIDEDAGFEIGDTWQTTRAQGAHVTLDNPGYYRDGYKCVGLTTSPNSTTPTYDLRDELKLNSDLELYLIWEKVI